MNETSELLKEFLEWSTSSEGILMLIMAGAFGPAIASVLAWVMNLPGIKVAVEGASFAAGKATSVFFIRLLKSKGKLFEDSIQSLITLIVGAFFKGLDVDDTVVVDAKTKPKPKPEN